MQKFSCDNSSTNFFKTDSLYCPDDAELQDIGVGEEVEKIHGTKLDNSAEKGMKSLSIKSKDVSMENGKCSCCPLREKSQMKM